MAKFVQSFITNVVAPKSLDELRDVTKDFHDAPLMDKLLFIERDDYTEWTVPRWAKRGDVVFFMHSKTSNSHLTAIRTELKNRYEEFDYLERRRLKYWINHGLDIYKHYGGKIFAIARVVGSPFSDTEETVTTHWASHIYAGINDFYYLENPVDISEFNSFITISRHGAITGVFGKEYDRLIRIISEKNKLPKRYRNILVDEVPLSKIDSSTWFDVMQRYRRAFLLEQQFRSYSVDYFLREFGDRRTFYSEVRCKKRGKADAFVDNLVLYRGKWLPVEVKLSIQLEPHLTDQLDKYMNVSKMETARGRTIKRQDLWLDRVLVVDTEGIYLYAYKQLDTVLKWAEFERKEEMFEVLAGRLESARTW